MRREVTGDVAGDDATRAAALDAYLEAEVVSQLRRRLGSLTALLGLPLWLVAWRPGLLPEAARQGSLWAWGLAALGTLALALRGWGLRRRLR